MMKDRQRLNQSLPTNPTPPDHRQVKVKQLTYAPSPSEPLRQRKCIAMKGKAY